MLRCSDETIHFNCVIPFDSITKMIIRETADSYEIILGTIISPYTILYNIYMYMLKGLTMMDYMRYEIFSQGDMEPIIVVKKDSDEPVGASFLWDFPAQLTTAEEIRTVVMADVFRKDLTTKTS